MQQYYGLNVDHMGADYSFHHASVLLAQIPRTARVSTAMHPSLLWDDQTRLLHSIEHTCRIIAWQRTEAARKRTGIPEPIKPPWTKPPKPKDVEKSAARVAEILKLKRVM